MGDLDVKVELWRMDDFCRDRRIVAVPTRAGKKPSDRMGSRSSAQNHIREIHDFSDMTELDEISSQIVSDVSGNCPEDKDSEESETSPDSTPIETTFFSSDVGDIFNSVSTEYTFSPKLMSTRIDDTSSSFSTRRMRGQTLCGTPGYMAPEMITYATHSFHVDCWVLGATRNADNYHAIQNVWC
ncbi:hypothetical protein GCK72_013830 [Caenorhabditis remanei]|uniref:Protein kinase domain-containing protein n=1 Tax=Caenorhabditis remanei TaxID=31234 RepID=A0A6A5GPR2_CAERE|nr:hypothetical protein GCK72_013826 [Caenorhabditis remanei]XP_053584786.1 hypothetical protein GCK72_013830 [Caenorhabditis remanei]KAF1757370.1 hypothetical protein GCK72_013826 [Caenorhabditis remanei]KAF1757374.1 hypothetical protein GCK72_013830 [Caenorhabditis remanei]